MFWIEFFVKKSGVGMKAPTLFLIGVKLILAPIVPMKSIPDFLFVWSRISPSFLMYHVMNFSTKSLTLLGPVQTLSIGSLESWV